MSLEEKVGQMFMLAFSRRRFDEVGMLIVKKKIGACYVSQENATTPSQAVVLSNKLQELALKTEMKIPMLICVDQEGSWGVVVPYTSTGPGNLALGTTGSPKLAFEMFRIYGKELSSMGYNTVLSPCVDVYSRPNRLVNAMRTFSNDPDLVAEMAANAIKGAHSGSIICCAKHYPGHGNADGDSHRDLPVNSHQFDEFERIDLMPFKAAIDAGVDIIMTAHLMCPSLDPHYPATLSKIILQDILRKKLQFDGVILTDSMNMGAIRKHFEPGEAAILAIKAGVDLIMLAEEHYDHDSDRYLEKQLHSIDSVIQAVEEGRIPEERIDNSVERILELKYKNKLFEFVKANLEDTEVVGCDEHRSFEVYVSSKAIKIMRGNTSDIYLPENKKILVINTITDSKYHLLTQSRGIGPNQSTPVYETFVECLQEKRKDVTSIRCDDIDINNGFPKILYDSDIILVVAEDYQIPATVFYGDKEGKFIASIVDTFPEKTIVIAFTDSQDIEDYPNVRTYVCAFSSRPCAARAMAERISNNE